MFKYTIDSKDSFVNDDNVEMLDLTESIFKMSDTDTVLYSYYKAPKETEMRPDLVSVFACGTDEYAEMIMKYSFIDNPFSLEAGDILAIPSVSSAYNEVNTNKFNDNKKDNENYSYLKNYHKYIDKTKVPDAPGSDDNTVSITSSQNIGSSNKITTNIGVKSPVEANFANNGRSGIHIQNGRIYFGDTVSVSSDNVEDVDGTNKVKSDLVDCASNGVTLGQFLNATIKNSI